MDGACHRCGEPRSPPFVSFMIDASRTFAKGTSFMQMRQGLHIFLSAACLAALGGCGGGSADGLPREAVSGSATLDDKPVPHGFIQFQPTSPDGVAAGGAITDGKYAISRDQGPTPGDYKVLISSSSGPEAASDEPPPPPGAPTPVAKDPIPAEYNSASKLTAKIEAGKENKIDFPMKSTTKKK